MVWCLGEIFMIFKPCLFFGKFLDSLILFLRIGQKGGIVFLGFFLLYIHPCIDWDGSLTVSTTELQKRLQLITKVVECKYSGSEPGS